MPGYTGKKHEVGRWLVSEGISQYLLGMLGAQNPFTQHLPISTTVTSDSQPPQTTTTHVYRYSVCYIAHLYTNQIRPNTNQRPC